MSADRKAASRVLSALIAAAVLAPGVRPWLEGDMARHMLLQFPLLIVAGWGLARGLPMRANTTLARVDQLGLLSLTFASVTLGLWMIPAALDAAVGAPQFAIVKYTSLLAMGALLSGVSRRAPLPIQAFFIGSIAWMTVTIGLLYQEAPQQLCLYYLTESQASTGRGLVLAAAAGATLWCVSVFRATRASARDSESSVTHRPWA